jgi:Fe-S-cluster containining protein
VSGAAPDLARAWLDAAADERVTADLEAVYEYIAAAVESRGPACWASGRCCNFEKAGHRLYVTGLEAAYTLRRSGITLSQDQIDAARAAGGCPFQQANLCGVHASRPLGCRVYFCDRSAEQWQQDLSERALAMVRAIHERYSIEYRYGEWRAMLEGLLGNPPAEE